MSRAPFGIPALPVEPNQERRRLGAVDLTSVPFSDPGKPEEKPTSGEPAPEGRGGKVGWALGTDSVRVCEGDNHVELEPCIVYHQLPHVSPDIHQQLVPPRFLEKFTFKKVKKGSSITFSVKVEGRVSCFPVPMRTPSPTPGRSPPCPYLGPS